MNYDILKIHNNIILNFENENEKLETYKKQLSILLNNDNCFSPKYKNEITQKIHDVGRKINNIENNIDYNFFILETQEILDQYKKLLHSPLKVSFFGKKSEPNEQNLTKTRKLFLKYIQIVKKYTKEDLRLNETLLEQNENCSNCNSVETSIYENEQTCMDCGNVDEVLTTTRSSRDIERVNISTKYSYDRQVHFKECIDKFQGKYTYIDDKVFNDIQKSLDLNKFEHPYTNLTKNHILLFLKEHKHGKHYFDVNYIYSYYTNKPKHNISHLEEQLLQDFELLLNLYNVEYKDDKTRKNFINTHYVLFQLLKRHKYQCQKEDFNILKTHEKRIYHDEVIKHLFMKLNWNYFPIM